MTTIQITPGQFEAKILGFEQLIKNYDEMLTKGCFSQSIKYGAERAREALMTERESYLGAVERGTIK